MAVVVWMFAKAGETKLTRLEVPVDVQNPDKRIQVEVEPDTVPVFIRYSREAEPYINSENFHFQIDTTDLRQGLGVEWKSKTMALSKNDWVANSPIPVELAEIGQNNTVVVRMRWHAVPAVVKPNLTGIERLADGLQLITPVKVTPADVYVIGDAESLASLSRDEETSKLRVLTQPINVAGLSQSIVKNVPINLPPGVELMGRASTAAEVSIEIQEITTVREIRGIKLSFEALAPDTVRLEYPQRTATIEVQGPNSLLKQLTPDSFRMVLIRPTEELPGTTKTLPVEAHFATSVSEDIRAKVVIRNVEPGTIQVRYLDAKPTSSTVERPIAIENP